MLKKNYNNVTMFKYFLKNSILLTTIYTIILTGLVEATAVEISMEDTICKSATIRSVDDFNQLQNCTLVVGFVRIVEMDISPKEYEELKPSKIKEINEYLMVYRVNGLDSLEKMFPLLAYIRGVDLLFDNYALTIMENRDLENIGLVSLLRVIRGSLRIESNPLLCYINTVDWMQIFGFEAKFADIRIANNKPTSRCTLCSFSESETEEQYVHTSCWSYEKVQKLIRKDFCPNSKCLTSCSDAFCKNCFNYVSDEGCTNFCQPNKYKLAFNRQCVTNCTKYGLIEHGLNCVEKCPKHYNTVINGGQISCVLNCTGDFVIHNIEDLEGLSDCSILNGSLTIEIHEMEENIVPHLEHAFQNINEITGYLKVLNSPQIITLYFFQNLHTIRGLQLIENRYSVYVVDNNYLEELFLGNVAIFNGCIYFHLNPLLCLNKIKDLEKNFRDCKKITIADVSEYSNGERAVCGYEQISNATVVDFNSTAALIEVDILPNDELLLLFGYVYFFKEAPFQNVTKFDGRHGCGKDGWFTNTVLTKRRRHIITNLKPATQYAYFVNSLTAIDYPYLAEHISEIRYFKTLPAKPSAVAKLYAVSRSGTHVDLHWWPPRIPNGIIEKYMLRYEIIDTTGSTETEVITPTVREICDCPNLPTDSHISTPYVAEFYNREQLIYKDDILNFLFQKKKPTESGRTKRNATDADYEALLNARHKMIMQKLQDAAVKKQEEGKESFIIEHPKPVCGHFDPNAQNQTAIACEPLETFENVTNIEGSQHSASITGLEPGKTYRFVLWACVKDLINGCGPAKVITATTISKQLAFLLANINKK